ncbi:MAG TPA: glycogen phosphorylase, partial [Pseudomonas sp.]|nr:glycogen phosphorylase [Pseudomonas sp.]
IFGLTAQEVNARKQGNEYNAEAIIAGSHRLSEVLSAIRGGGFSPGDPGRYVGLVDGISWHDTFMVCADFEAYWQAQLEVEERWRDPARWWRSSVLNTARTGWFSSDRTIREYAREIWKVM